MLHPSTELRKVSEEVGFGVFATAAIPRGTIVWTLDPLDQVLPPDRVERMPEAAIAVLERYAYVDGRGNRILCWDFGRFVNHSCDANAMGPGASFDLAVRDIAAGEEITNDYGLLNLERPFSCLCGAATCRGTVHPEDFERVADACDRRVTEAFPDLARVEQPLWSWIPPARQRRVRAASRGEVPVPSVLRQRFPIQAFASVRRDGRGTEGGCGEGPSER